MEVRIRHFLNSKKIRLLTEEINKKYPFLKNEISFKNAKVEYIETTEKIILYSVDNKLFWIEKEDIIIPSIVQLNLGLIFPKVIVDMGAVPFISKGADVMRPGIVNFPENISKSTIVKIVDVKYSKTIAVGETLIDSEEAKKIKKGKVIKILHHIGDEVWNLSIKLNLKIQ